MFVMDDDDDDDDGDDNNVVTVGICSRNSLPFPVGGLYSNP